MQYGCIGLPLTHSFSAPIHAALAGVKYELCELRPDELEAFFRRRDFKGINVTIPYKQTVIRFLDAVDSAAAEVGAVNTVVNRNGKLYGYNTDLSGLSWLIRRVGVSPKGLTAAVLGTGGTSRTAGAVLSRMGAERVLFVSRTGKDGAMTYPELERSAGEIGFLVNATPVGMFPATGAMPVDPAKFKNLRAVIDAVYNPLRTGLVLAARSCGIPSSGGLPMLVAQAAEAGKYFYGTEPDDGAIEKILHGLTVKKENIVLCGMPGCGKSSVGRALAQSTCREWIDTDGEIVRRIGRPIADYFATEGEAAFRALEREVIAKLSDRSGVVISTGGGTVLDPRNVEELKKNGRLYFLDRSPDALEPTPDRPLADDREKLSRLYAARLPVYRAVADRIVPVGDGEIGEVAEMIGKEHETDAGK